MNRIGPAASSDSTSLAGTRIAFDTLVCPSFPSAHSL